MAPTRPDARFRAPTAIVTGANGYIGGAVARAFVRAGYRVYGLIRRAESANSLEQAEVIPLIGTLHDLGFLDGLFTQTTTVDVIVNCLESFPEYETLFSQAIRLITTLSIKSNEHGVKPLVLWSSGCKDYGMTLRHGESNLAPHTEESPVNPPIDAVRARAETSLRIFDRSYHRDLFDGVVLRPTNVYGYTSSYYAAMLEGAEAQRASGRDVLHIAADPNGIQHALHIDDCADAYVALAQHKDRGAVVGHAFNISSYRYETIGEVGDALARAYGFPGGVKFSSSDDQSGGDDCAFESANLLFEFPQWVGSDKIRRVTGWKDRRMLFSENLTAYRYSYEAERQRGHENIGLVKARLSALGAIKVEGN